MDQPGIIEHRYLKAVLDWLDVNLDHLVNRWRLAGQDPEDRFRGLYVSDSEALTVTQRGVATHWGSKTALSVEKETEFEQVRARTLEAIKAAGNQEGYTSRLLALAETFGLSEFEWWAFIICLAPALDLRYEKIYGYLQDDVTAVQARVDLILMLLLPEGLSRLDQFHCFNEQSPLRKFKLIIPVEESAHPSPNILRQAFSVAPAVMNWILGQYTSRDLGNGAELIERDGDAEDNVQEVSEFQDVPSREIIDHVKPILSLYGNDLLQQELYMRRLSSALDKALLKVVIEKEMALEAALERLKLAVRDALMLNSLLYVEGGDFLIDREGCLLPAAFEIIMQKNESVFLSGEFPLKFSANMPGNDYPLMHIPVKDLTATERQEIWQVLIEGAGEISANDISALAGQFNLTSGEVIAASSMALSQALQKGRTLQISDLFDAARFHSGHHLGELAQKIEPRYAWEDLVLPETPMTMLKELVSMVKSRPKVLEEWGLGLKLTASSGVSALFTGQSGTGKTLAAQIIAHELGVDLYRIDLSTVVSKYIGETEKNLEHIFNEAQTSNAILFFDEADAIFGKRSEVKDAHDRYANIEVGYLLQRMESYSGLAILATNLRANLDEAFTRRLQFIITFPFPDEAYRLRIWKVLMPPGIPKAESLDLDVMAKRYKLAGGNIRNIIVSAAYLAANDGGMLTMQHLLHGARREFQKMGRLINDSDFVQPPLIR